MAKISITHTVHKDKEYPSCHRCKQSVILMQNECNCGCDGIYCRPCFYIHYRDHASKVTLQRFIEADEQEFNVEKLVKGFHNHEHLTHQ